MASIATVVTMGFGSFGSVNLLPTIGYGIASAVDQQIGLWHNLSLTSYDTNTSGADTVPMQTRNTDMSQVIQAGVDPT